MKVRYNSRIACDLLLEDIKKKGNWNMFTFGQKRDPCLSFFGKVMTSFHALTIESPRRPFNDPKLENICVTFSINMPGMATTAGTKAKGIRPAIAEGDISKPGHASGVQSLYSKTDNSFVKQLDPETLEPIGLAKQNLLHPSLTGPLSSAHARTDPVTGDLYNYNLDFGRSPVYRVFCVSASTGETTILATLSGAGIAPAYLHSMFLTPDYVVLCIWGSHFNMNGLAVVWQHNVLDAIGPFNPSSATKWLVIDRHHGRGLVAEFESPPMFCFHTVNAFQDENNDVICELVEYPNTDILHKFYYDALKSSSPAAHTFAKKKLPSCQTKLKRYRLSASSIPSTTLDRSNPPQSYPQAESIFSVEAGDLPTINPKYSLRSHRYVYTIVDRGLSTFLDGLAKTDMTTGTTIYWENEAGHTPSEAIFIANPEGEKEDDGVLLSVVLDGNKGTSYLLCLDSRDLKELGRAEVDGPIGFGFHGAFAASSGLAQNS